MGTGHRMPAEKEHLDGWVACHLMKDEDEEDPDVLLICLPTENEDGEEQWPCSFGDIGEMIEVEPGEGGFVSVDMLNAEIVRLRRGEDRITGYETGEGELVFRMLDGKDRELEYRLAGPDTMAGEALMETILRFMQGEEAGDLLPERGETAEGRLNHMLERERDR